MRFSTNILVLLHGFSLNPLILLGSEPIQVQCTIQIFRIENEPNGIIETNIHEARLSKISHEMQRITPWIPIHPGWQYEIRLRCQTYYPTMFHTWQSEYTFNGKFAIKIHSYAQTAFNSSGSSIFNAMHFNQFTK